ncbi:short-chain dehydrogenases/reductases (SDR) family protein [Abortiporus biennis]
MVQSQRVWLITGTSSGFGKRLVASVLARGDKVIATARSLSSIQSLQQSSPSSHPSQLHLLQLDLNDSLEIIQSRIKEAFGVWGRIDVLVNNAGFGMKSVIEEGGSLAALTQFQTNVFGTINVTNSVIPYMRDQRSGTIIIVGSRSGWTPAMPPVGFYSASKAAIHAIGETYASELSPFGIRVTIIIPGSFRTENVLKQPLTIHNHIPEYDTLRSTAQKKFEQIAGTEKGDPRKAMELLVDVVRGEGKVRGREWPMWLFLGKDCYRDVENKCERVRRNLREWEDLTNDLEFDEVC